jgi:hypothetical protein
MAAEAAGIGRSTFHHWMQQGSDDEAAERETVFVLPV